MLNNRIGNQEYVKSAEFQHEEFYDYLCDSIMFMYVILYIIYKIYVHMYMCK